MRCIADGIIENDGGDRFAFGALKQVIEVEILGHSCHRSTRWIGDLVTMHCCHMTAPRDCHEPA